MVFQKSEKFVSFMMQIVAEGFSKKRKILISDVLGPRIQSGLDRFMGLGLYGRVSAVQKFNLISKSLFVNVRPLPFFNF